MPSASQSLGFIVYAPQLRGDASRALAAVHALERTPPRARLRWEVSEEGLPVELPNRDEWLTQAVTRGEFPLLCNGDESYPVTIFGCEAPALLAPGGQPEFEVHIELPLDETVIAAAMDVLKSVAEGAGARWGLATPDRAAVEIAEQTNNPLLPEPRLPPRGLPALRPAEQLPSPQIPHRLGWLNYWSTATAAALGFPDETRDAHLLAWARRTTTGAWLVALTDAPLELDNPAHLEVLLRAYERFPRIGGRSDS